MQPPDNLMAKKAPAAKQKSNKPAPKKKVAAKAPAAKSPHTTLDQKAALQQQIEALQGQIVALQQVAIEELKSKLAEARKVVSTLEAELATLTGKPAGESKVKRTRRPSITDEHLQPQLLAVMAEHGRGGMNAKQLAEHLQQDAIRIRKFIADNAQLLKRTGSGAGTKFFLT